MLHVIRRNLFAQACSEQIAAARGSWHAAVDEKSGQCLRQAGLTLGPRPQGKEPVVLDPRSVEATMRWSEDTRGLFRNWCKGYSHYAEVEYEQIFDGDRLSGQAYDVLRGLTGMDLDEQKPVPWQRW